MNINIGPDQNVNKLIFIKNKIKYGWVNKNWGYKNTRCLNEIMIYKQGNTYINIKKKILEV